MTMLWMIMVGLSIFGHFIMYITNESEHYDNLYAMRAIHMSLLLSLQILIFTIIYSIQTGIIELDSFLIIYYVISITSYIIHYILDNDFIFQLNKFVNYLVVIGYDVLLLSFIVLF